MINKEEDLRRSAIANYYNDPIFHNMVDSICAAVRHGYYDFRQLRVMVDFAECKHRDDELKQLVEGKSEETNKSNHKRREEGL